MHFAAQVAAPAGIGAGGQARELAKLRVAPLQVEMDGHLAQIGRTLRAGFELHDPGVGQVQAHVGAGGLAAQP